LHRKVDNEYIIEEECQILDVCSRGKSERSASIVYFCTSNESSVCVRERKRQRERERERERGSSCCGSKQVQTLMMPKGAIG
jgi:hypothetical protein